MKCDSVATAILNNHGEFRFVATSARSLCVFFSSPEEAEQSWPETFVAKIPKRINLCRQNSHSWSLECPVRWFLVILCGVFGGFPGHEVPFVGGKTETREHKRKKRKKTQWQQTWWFCFDKSQFLCIFLSILPHLPGILGYSVMLLGGEGVQCG